MCISLLEQTIERLQSAPTVSGNIPGGAETILLIEDEEKLRDLLKEILISNGYTVIIAQDGEEGVEVYSCHQNEISLVVTDLGFPKLEGNEVSKRIKMMNPLARVIVASGLISLSYGSEAKNWNQAFHSQTVFDERRAKSNTGDP